MNVAKIIHAGDKCVEKFNLENPPKINQPVTKAEKIFRKALMKISFIVYGVQFWIS